MIIKPIAERPMRALRDGPWMRELTELPTDSVWFQAFLSGMRARMGESLKQDMALTPDIVLAVLELCEEEWATALAAGDGQPQPSRSRRQYSLY